MWELAGHGWGWVGIGMVHMLLFWAFVIFAIVYLSGTSSESSRETNKVPLDILKERYARGEIENPDYEEKRRELQS